MKFDTRALIAGLAVCTAAPSVMAQNQALGQPQQVEDVLTFEAGVDVARHDNIFSLASGVSPLGIYGKSDRADTVVTGRFGVKFDRDISLQRVTLSGEVRPTKYLTYTKFDNLGYTGLANWDWAIGRPWFGTVGARLNQQLSDFADVQQSDKNLQKLNTLYFTAGMRLTPSWAVIAGVDSASLSNSTAAQRASDYTFVSTEVGAKYAPGTGTELGLVYRTTNGDYKNRQVVDSVGGVLGVNGGVDNGFTQDAILARVAYKPSEDSRIAGSIGVTKRKFDNFSQRDFSGPTAQVNVDWRPGGAFFMGVDLIRDIYSEEVLTANYVEVTALRLRPSFRLTGKLTLTGLFSLEKRQYGGDPGFVASGNAVRDDELKNLGARLTWDYARNIQFYASYTRASRTSNYANLDFTDNVIGFGGKLSF